MTVPRLRQLVIAAERLETADRLRELLGLGAPFADEGVGMFGLVNAVFAIGDQFLEVIVPTADDAPARRFLNRGGEGGYMVIFQTDDLKSLRARCDGLGIRRVWNTDMPDILASHLHPADMGGAIVSVDEPHPAGSWRWGGPEWRERSVPGRLVSACIETPDPEAMSQRWALALGMTADKRRLFLQDALIEFREGRADRPVRFGLQCGDAGAVLARAEEMGLPVDGHEVSLAGVGLSILA